MNRTIVFTGIFFAGVTVAYAISPVSIEVDTPAQLEAINQNLSGQYILGQDIDLRGYSFTPIGSMNDAFTGIFNGNGHRIINLAINMPKGYDTGLFANLAPAAVIANLNVDNADVHGFNTTGIVAGINSGTITNVNVSGHVSGDNNTGGLIGANDGKVSDSSAEVTVNPQGNFAGGLIGGNGGGIVLHSYAVAVVDDPLGSHVGGLSGDNMGEITQSYAEGAVSGVDNVGGLSGGNYQGRLENDYATVTVNATGMFVGGLSGDNTDGASLVDSYSTGHVIGSDQYVGGLVGYSEGPVQDSYWDVDTSGQANSSGGVGKTDQAMQNIDTYQSWDFNNVWQMNAYPALRGFN